MVGVSLFDVDDLEAVVARNRKVRQGEARRAEGIVEEEIQSFATWLGSLEVLPTLAALRTHATEIAEQVVSENDGRWESASERDLERVQRDLHGRSSTGFCITRRCGSRSFAMIVCTRAWRWFATCSG